MPQPGLYYCILYELRNSAPFCLLLVFSPRNFHLIFPANRAVVFLFINRESKVSPESKVLMPSCFKLPSQHVLTVCCTKSLTRVAFNAGWSCAIWTSCYCSLLLHMCLLPPSPALLCTCQSCKVLRALFFFFFFGGVKDWVAKCCKHSGSGWLQGSDGEGGVLPLQETVLGRMGWWQEE